jgi:hypothetical protein
MERSYFDPLLATMVSSRYLTLIFLFFAGRMVANTDGHRLLIVNRRLAGA